jgi:hypothetical protein
LNRQINQFVNLLIIYKPIKLQPLWDAFRKHNPNQKGHKSTYLTSLMAHVQSFKVLSTKCIWSSDFILINIQLAQLKLDSLAPCCQAWPLFGLHLCWSINHPYLTTLKCLLKNSMPPLDIRTKKTCLTSIYNFFVKDHIELQYIHQSSNNWLAIFHGVKQRS